MNDRDVLLAAVEANPDDEARRAALADWLAENPTRLADTVYRLLWVGMRWGHENARRLCVRRMTGWTEADDQRTADFRDGIERACSDVARRLVDAGLPAKDLPDPERP